MRYSLGKGTRTGTYTDVSKPLVLKGEGSSQGEVGTPQDMDLYRLGKALVINNNGSLERIITDKQFGLGSVFLCSASGDIGLVDYGATVINTTDSEIIVSYTLLNEPGEVTLEPMSEYILPFNNGWTRKGGYISGSSDGGDSTTIYSGSVNEVNYLDKVQITGTNIQAIAYFPYRHPDGSGPDPSIIFESVNHSAVNFHMLIQGTRNNGDEFGHQIYYVNNVFEYLYDNGFSGGNIPLDYVLSAAYDQFGADPYSDWWANVDYKSLIKIRFYRAASGNLADANIKLKIVGENTFVGLNKAILEVPSYKKKYSTGFVNGLEPIVTPTVSFYEYSGDINIGSGGGWAPNAQTFTEGERSDTAKLKKGIKFLGDTFNQGAFTNVVDNLVTGRLAYRRTIGRAYEQETVEVGYRYYNRGNYAVWLWNNYIVRPNTLFISDDMDNVVTGDTFYDGTADGFYYIRPAIEYADEEAYYNYGPVTVNNAHSIYTTKFYMSTDPTFDPIAFIDWSRSGPLVHIALRVDGQWYVPLFRRFEEQYSVVHFDGNDSFPDIASVNTTTADLLIHPIFNNSYIQYAKIIVNNPDPAVDLYVKPGRMNAPTQIIKPGEEKQIELYMEAHSDNIDLYGINCRVWYQSTPAEDAIVSLIELGYAQGHPNDLEWWNNSI